MGFVFTAGGGTWCHTTPLIPPPLHVQHVQSTCNRIVVRILLFVASKVFFALVNNLITCMPVILYVYIQFPIINCTQKQIHECPKRAISTRITFLIDFGQKRWIPNQYYSDQINEHTCLAFLIKNPPCNNCSCNKLFHPPCKFIKGQ